MKRLLLLVALCATCTGLLAPGSATADTYRPDLLRHFAQAGTSGTMVVHRSGSRPQTIVVGKRRSSTRYLPSSTFKIPNALLAIDRGVASGADQRYPGPNPNTIVDGRPFLPLVCEGDLTLATALANSCIPIFQQLARELGRPAYRKALAAMRYGNQNIAGAPLDEFWLRGPFAISAREQVTFLQRLRHGALPVSRHSIREVHRMLVLERDGDTVLRGKTGYVFSTDPHVGWWVGWVARGDRTWTFALNLDITGPVHAAQRVPIGRAILHELGALPQP